MYLIAIGVFKLLLQAPFNRYSTAIQPPSNRKSPMKKFIAVIGILLAGCAAEVISTTDQLIVVKARERNRPEAQDLAEAKCQQRGLHARLTRRLAEDQLGFECVR